MITKAFDGYITKTTLLDILYCYERVGSVEEGEGVELDCRYNPSPGQYIDSIKWYLNASEIYRIVPGLNDHR